MGTFFLLLFALLFDLLSNFIFWNNCFLLFGIVLLFLLFFSGIYFSHSFIIISSNMFRHVSVFLSLNISFHCISSSSFLILSHSSLSLLLFIFFMPFSFLSF